MGIFAILTLLGSKNNVKFSVNIPFLTFTMHHLLSDPLLFCKGAILASYRFPGFPTPRRIVSAATYNMRCPSLSKVRYFSLKLTWTYFSFLVKTDRKYSHANSYIFVMTGTTRDDDLTAGAWATCDECLIRCERKGPKHRTSYYLFLLLRFGRSSFLLKIKVFTPLDMSCWWDLQASNSSEFRAASIK